MKTRKAKPSLLSIAQWALDAQKNRAVKSIFKPGDIILCKDSDSTFHNCIGVISQVSDLYLPTDDDDLNHLDRNVSYEIDFGPNGSESWIDEKKLVMLKAK